MTPAWHDVPPVPGIYTREQSDGSYENVAVFAPKNWGRGHYYGPRDGELPDPPPIPEPPKPPRLFRCKYQNGVRYGVFFVNGDWRAFDVEGRQVVSSNGTRALEGHFTDIEFLDGAPA